MPMRKAIQWFISLVHRDMELFEVDVSEKEKTYQQIKYKKEKHTKNHTPNT